MSPSAFAVMVCSIVCEVIGTTALKLTNGGARPLWYILVAIAYVLAFLLLSQALKSIPLGVAYALWSGLGMIGTALIGVYLFKQHLSWISMSGIAIILFGVVLVNWGVQKGAAL